MPLYKKVAEQICRDYVAEPTLPGERQLAERYACARTTIRLALKELQLASRLESSARTGHRLIGPAGDVTPASSVSPVPARTVWNVVMLVGSWQLVDQNFLNFVAGVLEAARQHPVNLVTRVVDENRDLSGVTSLALLHPGIEADAYILTSLSEKLRGFAENQLKPCVVLGSSGTLEPDDRRRFVQILQPSRERVQSLLQLLQRHGHRKILAVVPSALLHEDLTATLQCHPEWELDCDIVDVTLNHDSTTVAPGVAEAVYARLQRHTALLLFFGGASSLAVYRKLTAAGIEIPRRLSLVADSGRFDYYIRVCGIASVYFDTREEGRSCIEELLRQLQTGQLNFECRIAGHCFHPGHTIVAAMAPDAITAYDRMRQQRRNG